MSDNPYRNFGDPDQTFGEHVEPDGGDLPNDIRNWAMLCHLIALLAMPLGFGHLLGPLLVWLIKRSDHPFIDDQGKESVNFQISITVYTLLVSPTLCLVVGIPLLVALWLGNVVLIVMAALKASAGETYRYPLCLRLIK